jgi:multiple sugar transport system permease protein
MSQQTAAPPRADAAPSAKPRRSVGDLWVALLFIAPAAIGFGVFYLYPTLRGIYLSFTEYSLLGTPEFIGLENYQNIVQDELFWNAMKVTIWYVILNIGFQTIIALGLAVLMHRLTQSTVLRGLVLTPYLISMVVVSLLWFWMLDFNIGIVNELLEAIGIGRIPFFGSETWAIPTIAWVNVWRFVGYTALLIFAGLQTIPASVYEAAALDGSSEWRTFWRITVPLLRPILVLVLVLTVIGSFQIFDTVAVTTAGGPGNASRVIMFYIFERAFERSDFGYASALSMILFVILAGVAIAQMKILRGGESDVA